MNDTQPPGPASAADGLRFAFGFLTVLPVRSGRWDRDTARLGMIYAPVAGLVVGLATATAGGILLVLGGGALLAATVTVAAGAVLTRGLHLDGLADTADALGSGRDAEGARYVMKQPDIGPFGVVTLLLVLIAQVAALAGVYGESGWAAGAAAAAVAAFTARGALTVACREGVPAARPKGLGAAVAGAVPQRSAVATVVATIGAGVAAGALFGVESMAQYAAAQLTALVAAELLLGHCRRRFGGVTGDVFGALVETAATVTLVVLALGR